MTCCDVCLSQGLFPSCHEDLPPDHAGSLHELGVHIAVQAALDLLADLMTNCRECLREGLVLLLRLMFALEPQLEFRWRLQPEAIIRRVTFCPFVRYYWLF